MIRTLQGVDPKWREWQSEKYGPKASFSIVFDDNLKGEVTTNLDKAEKVLETLQAAIGVPGEYALEDQGTFKSGDKKPMKVTDYPGKPKQQGRGGGGGGGGGQGGGNWEAEHERTVNRGSMEAQGITRKATDLAIEALKLDEKMTPDKALDFLETVALRLATVHGQIREDLVASYRRDIMATVAVSGSGSQPAGAGQPPTGASATDAGMGPSLPSGGEATADGDGPGPGPDTGTDRTVPNRSKVLNIVLKHFEGSGPALTKAFEDAFPDRPTARPSGMKLEELLEIAKLLKIDLKT